MTVTSVAVPVHILRKMTVTLVRCKMPRQAK